MELYIYDHCPYCTRERMIFGFKKISYSEIILDNDDEKTPITMIGKKSLPILKFKENQYLGESLDIVSYINSIDENNSLTQSRNIDIENWVKNMELSIYELAMPRWAFSNFKEFNKISARMYFIEKKQAALGSFSKLIHLSTEKIDFITKELSILNELIDIDLLKKSHQSWSYTDIFLFPILRSLSIVKGIVWPESVLYWMEKMSEQCGISLHSDIAL